jgi:predicted O-methyltransferase YrrM
VLVSLNETDFLFPSNLRLLRDAARLGHLPRAADAPPGLLEEREGICLYVLGRRAAEIGKIVEIGAFKGRSTWYLAHALEAAQSPHHVVSIDPHLERTRDEFERGVAAGGLAHRIESHVAYSHELADRIAGPIGLLWIDGDHSYDAVRRDFDDWFPLLAPGGWLAFHDTVDVWYGPTRLARELLSKRSDLASIGVIGSITYARKTPPSAIRRLAAWRARAAFELVTVLRRGRFGRGPLNAAPGDL